MNDADMLKIAREIVEGRTRDDCNCRPDGDGIVHEQCTIHQLVSLFELPSHLGEEGL